MDRIGTLRIGRADKESSEAKNQLISSSILLRPGSRGPVCFFKSCTTKLGGKCVSSGHGLAGVDSPGAAARMEREPLWRIIINFQKCPALERAGTMIIIWANGSGLAPD